MLSAAGTVRPEDGTLLGFLCRRATPYSGPMRHNRKPDIARGGPPGPHEQSPMANTLYDTLEVIPTASAQTIQAAYRSLISRYHPDKVAGLGPELQAVASARTKEINNAYDVLRDAARRASYDEELREREPPSPRQRDFVAERGDEELREREPPSSRQRT